MNFPLLYIELHIDDSLVEIGERLIAKDRINGLHESEKNLWAANVQEGNIYEVEVQLTNNRVKAYTCDCDKYAANKICAHIAGVLVLVREEIKQREANKEAKKSKKKSTSGTQKLTINSILKNINPEELHTFVRAYARSNRAFTLALKAKFASNVALENNQDKYKQVLDTAVNINKTAKGVNQRALTNILVIAEELMNQADDAIVMRHFTEAFAIVEAIFSRLGFLNKSGKNFPEWKKCIHRNLQLTKEILTKNVAPDLEEYIWEVVKEEAYKSYYRRANLESDFFQILLDLATDSDKLNELLVLADEQLQKLDINDQNMVNLLSLKLAVLEKEGKNKEAEKLIQENLSNPTILLIAINDAINKDNLHRAKQLAHTGLATSPSKLVSISIEKTLLTVAKKENDQKQIAHYAESLFLHSFDFEYYQLLKLSAKMKKKDMDNLIKKIEVQPYSLQKRDTIAELYFQENRLDDLLNYIGKIRSLDLLKRYDATLLEKHKKQVYGFYEDFLNSYLTNHIGRVPALRVSQFIQHLRSIGARDLAGKLVQTFRDDYSERHTLMEELQFF